MSISCFGEDLDLISKIFKMLFDGSSGFVGARLFEHCRNVGFPKNDICKNIWLKCSKKFLIFRGIRVSSKIKTIGVGAWGHVKKSRNHRN